MDVKQGTNKFYIGDDPQNPIGELTYIPDDDNKLIVNSIVVDKERRGQGMGDQLLDAVANYAREKNKALVGQCPFVAARFEKFPDRYRDVIFNP